MVDIIIPKMRAERERIIEAMQKKDLSSVEHRHLAAAFDILSKNINLSEGKPTEIVNNLSGLSDAELEAMAYGIDENTKSAAGAGEEGVSQA